MEIRTVGETVIARLDASYSAFQEHLITEAEERIDSILVGEPVRHLLLDFQDTEYFGSVFFESLFRLWKRCQELGGRFALCQLRPDCQEILDTARLTTLWEFYPDIATALDQFGTQQTISGAQSNSLG